MSGSFVRLPGTRRFIARLKADGAGRGAPGRGLTTRVDGAERHVPVPRGRAPDGRVAGPALFTLGGERNRDGRDGGRGGRDGRRDAVGRRPPARVELSGLRCGRHAARHGHGPLQRRGHEPVRVPVPVGGAVRPLLLHAHEGGAAHHLHRDRLRGSAGAGPGRRAARRERLADRVRRGGAEVELHRRHAGRGGRYS